MNCTFCEEDSISAIHIRTGKHHEAQDQRDLSRVSTIRMCRDHQIEFFNWVVSMSTKEDR